MLEIIKESMDVFNAIAEEIASMSEMNGTVDPSYRNFSHAQLKYYSERCHTVSCLVQVGKLWDAEIVMRAALECATRFVFVSIADAPERNIRLKEYSCDLAEINDISHSERAKSFREHSDRPNSNLINGVVLSSEQESLLRAKWPKSKRKIILQKWSFSAMVVEITRFNKNGLNLIYYNNFLHGYGLASHLIHADQTALGLVWDRNQRGEGEYAALINAHTARICTDFVGLFLICWKCALYVAGEVRWGGEIDRRVLDLFSRCEVLNKEFSATQTEFYREYSRN